MEPIACDPSGLPKFPPSKELDAKKLRDVEAGRYINSYLFICLNLHSVSVKCFESADCCLFSLPSKLFFFRQREATKKGNDDESGRKLLKHSKGIPILDANVESQVYYQLGCTEILFVFLLKREHSSSLTGIICLGSCVQKFINRDSVLRSSDFVNVDICCLEYCKSCLTMFTFNVVHKLKFSFYHVIISFFIYSC